MYKTGIYIFRRDLRIEDNLSLHKACKECEKVICIFILDPQQTNPDNNKYFSYNAFAFMLESLIELQKQINLLILKGDPDVIISHMIKQFKPDLAIYSMMDYTPYAAKRDSSIKKILNGIPYYLTNDVALNSPLDIKPYKVFTPYYNVARLNSIVKKVQPITDKIIKYKLHGKLGGTTYLPPDVSDLPIKLSDVPDVSDVPDILDISGGLIEFDIVEQTIGGNPMGRFIVPDLHVELSKIASKTAKLRQSGGRAAGLAHLHILHKIKYNERDFPSVETSRLSPYIKFGVIGCREVYRKAMSIPVLAVREKFIRQLYWRDFYLQIGYHYSHVFGSNFRGILRWKHNSKWFAAWCDGKTGIPIVDAAMTELNTTGYMHNRCRMIVANLLTRLMHIDWKYGEKYFASKLTDYDPCNNNGGWQWASGTGADPQPYYRIFNPYIQAEKYDPECKYIKKYLPHLSTKTPKEIFAMRSSIFDYEKERNIAMRDFKITSDL